MAQYPVPPSDYYGDVRAWVHKIRDAVAGLMDGKANNIGSITLTASSATTTLSDRRITAASVIVFMPKTSNAAGAVGGLYVTARTNGQATLNHANNAQTDKSFDYVVVA